MMRRGDKGLGGNKTETRPQSRRETISIQIVVVVVMLIGIVLAQLIGHVIQQKRSMELLF